MTKANEIRGGNSILNAYAICDTWNGDIYEMSKEVAEEFGKANHFKLVGVYNLRTDKDVQEEVKMIPNLNKDAWHALEMANLRGTTVQVIYFDEEMYYKHFINEEKYANLYKVISSLPMNDWEKVNKILLKHGFDIRKINPQQ